MTIKPIDLQTNIGQIHEVSKGEKVRSDTIVEQQNLLDKESNDLSRLAPTKVEENKKGEKTAIMREERNEQRRRQEQQRREKQKKDESAGESKIMRDDRLGKIIDVKK